MEENVNCGEIVSVISMKSEKMTFAPEKEAITLNVENLLINVLQRGYSDPIAGLEALYLTL